MASLCNEGCGELGDTGEFPGVFVERDLGRLSSLAFVALGRGLYGRLVRRARFPRACAGVGLGGGATTRSTTMAYCTGRLGRFLNKRRTAEGAGDALRISKGLACGLEVQVALPTVASYRAPNVEPATPVVALVMFVTGWSVIFELEFVVCG